MDDTNRGVTATRRFCSVWDSVWPKKLISQSKNLWVLIAARFLQGIFIPALTTCLAAFLFMGPLAGKLGSRYGSGNTLLCGALTLDASLVLFLVPSFTAIIGALACACAGFFTVHVAAVASLNQKLSSGQGRANSLYILNRWI